LSDSKDLQDWERCVSFNRKANGFAFFLDYQLLDRSAAEWRRLASQQMRAMGNLQ
jgi:hypothetical protein